MGLHSLKRFIKTLLVTGLVSVMVYLMLVVFNAGERRNIYGSLNSHVNFKNNFTEYLTFSETVVKAPSLECDSRSSKWITKIAEQTLNVTSQFWVPTGNATDIFLYSAYYDTNDNNETIVRVIGAGLVNVKHNVTCIIHWTSNNECLDVHSATVEIMPDVNKKKYGALFVICKVPDNKKPFAVSITGEGGSEVKNKILIKYPERHRYNITVCLACIHSNYNNDFGTVESIELDQILGAEHFVIYKYWIGPKVLKVFKYYSDLGILDIKTWNLPHIHIHYFGQMVAVNDCVYSNRGKSAFVIVKDLDEVLAPYKDGNLPSLIKRLLKENPRAGSISFRNTFFDKTWSDDTKNFKYAPQAKRLQLNTLLKVWRENFTYGSKGRAKTIRIPDRVIVNGIHFSWKNRRPFLSIVVRPNEGLLHHYRFGKTEEKRGKLKEEFLRLYSEQLIHRCNKTLNRLHQNSVANKHN